MAAVVTDNRGRSSRRICDASSHLGGRTVEVRAVGAWVQPEPLRIINQSNAVLSAQAEEERIRRKHRDKEQRLRQFQDDVKKRVTLMEKLKREQQLDKSCRAVEVERNVVRQSAFAAEKCTPRKNRCTLRRDDEHRIRHSGNVSTQGCIITVADKGCDPNQFAEQTQQIHKHNKQARRNLTSRKVVTEHYVRDDLPGGSWRQGPTLDHTSSRNAENMNDSDLDADPDEAEEDTQDSRTVHFATESNMPIQPGRRSKSAVAAHRVPDIYPGVFSEEEKLRERNQRAMYRRLFMDIEREQVKENLRQQEHQLRIEKLKKSKEEERKRLEEEAQSMVEPKDPVTGETPGESFERERTMEEHRRQASAKHQQRLNKGRETVRFLEALKRNLREKVANQKIELPPLCCCGESVWDSNPDTCANNCVFYKNPKAYAKALQSLLVSADVV